MNNFLPLCVLYSKNLIRNRGFIFSLLSLLLIGIFIIPNENSTYYTFSIANYTGTPNNAWVSNLGAIFANVIIGFVGFFFLEGQYKEEKDSGIGNLIRVSPSSNFLLILHRWVSSFFALLLMLVGLIIILFITNYNEDFQVLSFLRPFLYYSIPCLASFSILILSFDILIHHRGLKITVYILMCLVLLFPTLQQIDPYGLTEFSQHASHNLPVQLNDTNYSFGVIARTTDIHYINYDRSDLDCTQCWKRGVYILAALVIFALLVILFDRFKKGAHILPKIPSLGKTENTTALPLNFAELSLSNQIFSVNKNYKVLFELHFTFLKAAFSRKKILLIIGLWGLAFLINNDIKGGIVMPLLFIASFFLIEKFVNVQQEQNIQSSFITSIYNSLELNVTKAILLFFYFFLLSLPAIIANSLALNIKLIVFLMLLSTILITYTQFFKSIKIPEIVYILFFICYLSGYPIITIF